MKTDKTVQQDLFGVIIKDTDCENKDNCKEATTEFKKIDIENFVGEHKCPRCGFEWND